MRFEDNIGAQLASLERAIKAGRPIDALAWYDWLTDAIEINVDDNRVRGWASRLSELVVEAMTDEQYAQWGLSHGWVGDDGHWHCPSPREDGCDEP